MFQSLNFYLVDTTMELCAAESFGGGYVKKTVLFQIDLQLAKSDFYEAVILCDCIIKEAIFDVTVFIGPSVCSKTGQDLS